MGFNHELHKLHKFIIEAIKGAAFRVVREIRGRKAESKVTQVCVTQICVFNKNIVPLRNRQEMAHPLKNRTLYFGKGCVHIRVIPRIDVPPYMMPYSPNQQASLMRPVASFDCYYELV